MSPSSAVESPATEEVRRVGKFSITKKSPQSGSAPTQPHHAGHEASLDEIQQFAQGASTKDTTPPPNTFFRLALEDRRGDLVVVKGSIRKSDTAKSSYLPIPGPTYNRLEKVLAGALTPGIIGLIEYALDDLERQGKTLVIHNHKKEG